MTIVAMPPAGRSAGASVGSPLARYLAGLHERHRQVTAGTVATYIPELGRADPDWFGIAVVTLDGRRHAVGDADIPFTIQSISKPLTYGLVLDDLGEAAVRARIGVEPTGDAFNSITLSPMTGLPLNPMVNAGAIAAAGLVRTGDGGDPLRRLLDGYGRFIGHPVAIDRAVFASERETGFRNRAIGHLLRASGALDGDTDTAVERYFAQCSVLVTARDLAMIAATLANGGVHPATGERALSEEHTRAVLAVMASCGMYDGAGEWLYTVGLPAKSGVSGGVMVVVPGRMGIAVFSPPLDANGNSVRGVLVCRDLVDDLRLHPLRGGSAGGGSIRTTYRAADVGSKRRRTERQRAALQLRGTRCLVIEAQGALTYLAPDEIADTIDAARPLEVVIVDLRRVDRIEPAAVDLLGGLVSRLALDGVDVVVSGGHQLDALAGDHARVHFLADLDAALEFAEERLLTGADVHAADAVTFGDQSLVMGLVPGDLAAVASRVQRRTWSAGSTVVARGEPSAELFLIESGQASVTIGLEGGGRRRLSTMGPGMSFGEAALLDGGVRSADVVADTDLACLVLTVTAFEDLLAQHPAVAAALLRNLLRTVGATAGRLTREVAVLAS